MDVLQRRLSSNPVLSGNYQGLAGAWQCALPVGALGATGAPGAPGASRGGYWQVQWAHGTDSPKDPLRPGGRQLQSLIRLTAVAGPWLADLEVERRQDATPYSALLGGEVRKVLRKAGRLEWQTRLPTGLGAPGGLPLELRLGSEWSLQRSNLALFGARSWGPYVALRQAW